jgi:peptide/nickel transport system substrate-binding protein
LGEAQNSPISRQSPYFWEGVQGYEYNPEKAKELLLEAGFQYNEEGQLLDDQGNRVRFTLLTNAGNKVREAIGAQIKQDLSKIGITVDFNPVAFSVLVDKLSNSLDWEAHIIGFTGGNEPNDGANLWNVQGGLHFFNQQPLPGQPPVEGQVVAPWEQEISDLYVEAAGELDEAERKELYARTQEITQENLPLIFLVNPLSLAAVRDRVQGVEYSALGGAFWNIDELRLTP